MHPTLRNPGAVALMVVDVQERLLQAMAEPDETIAATACAVRIARRLELPLVVTEQYPKGLGHTVPAVADQFAPETPVFEKTAFSCFGCAAVAAELDRTRPDTLALCGVETHVCVQQTALDALERGFHVVVLADAVLSRRETDRGVALELLRARGVTVTTVESLAFAIMRDAKHAAFKAVSRIVQDR